MQRAPRATMVQLVHALVAVTVTACSTAYVYQPRNAVGWLDGYPATRTAVPPEAPRGAVETASFGVVELMINGGALDALHARLAITNDGDPTPWSLATSAQLVDLPGHGQRGPMYINTDVAANASILIAQHERRVVDLYYALPPGDHDISHFRLRWTVAAPVREVAAYTEFERVARDDVEHDPTERYPRVFLHAGWGPRWWYDPFWVQPRFDGPIILIRPGSVLVTRRPHWASEPTR